MKTKLAISLLIVCALLLMGSVWKAPNTSEIFWYVLGGGGGRVTNGSITVEGTLGQPVAGFVSQSPLELCSGYWCGAGVSSYQVYLPLVLR
jgi:hypothetical protein